MVTCVALFPHLLNTKVKMLILNKQVTYRKNRFNNCDLYLIKSAH